MAYNLTVKQFQHISKISKSSKDELDKQIEIVSYLSGKSEDEVLKLPLDKIKQVFSECGFAAPSTGLHKYIFVNGILYKGCLDITSLDAGQYIDLKNFAKQGINENLHNLLACVYKPVFGKYNHSKIANDMLKAKLNKVYGLVFFYSAVLELLNPTILMCSVLAAQDIEETMKEIEKEWKDL